MLHNSILGSDELEAIGCEGDGAADCLRFCKTRLHQDYLTFTEFLQSHRKNWTGHAIANADDSFRFDVVCELCGPLIDVSSSIYLLYERRDNIRVGECGM